MMNRTKILLAVSAATVLIGAAGGAVAHRSDWHGDRSQRGAMMFERLDTDNDGKVTRAEAEAYRDSKITEFDKDNDGALNQAEYTAMMQSMMAEHMQRRFERRDADGDGKLSPSEMSSRMDRMFKHMDENGDGAIERSEMGNRGHGMKRGGAWHD
jgi:Ca2+-binding EF-hand superfamily protein